MSTKKSKRFTRADSPLAKKVVQLQKNKGSAPLLFPPPVPKAESA
jgi:hypothetical protein